MKNVIMDVDTGVDDALAILYALESRQLDVLGITTVNGNVPLEMVNANTLKVLSLAGRTDVPVHPGADRPLLRTSEHVHHIHGDDGIGNALDGYEYSNQCQEQFAADFIIEQAKRHPGEVTLIAVGPLTNLALAFRKEPKLSEWLDEVVIMGGLVSEMGRGNKLPNSEFNIYTDAEAAQIVFHSGAETTLVSLDVTKQTLLSNEDIRRLEGRKYHDFVKKSTEVYRAFSKEKFNLDGCALHDPLTVGYVLNKDFLKTEKYHVDVDTVSPLNYGQTVCDFVGLLGREPNVNVCLGVDAEGFVSHFLETLGKEG
ncbi:nucleoside hydrolase [Salinicoccus roseus]|uniref:nucleoside hydrolase n=1 Tax=Salinicoccus roseus TaxID=45670 RepID=UPI001EF42BF8|nr:nucleoside hydrolase [Salinicoccus roseus]MCG7332490.1 nucleoside hydrolase [Salinicoccus roseus]